ncbi:SagB family peptide dehydrogenase [Microbacterium sediminicola]|uniref:SagB family peptide dehydrogenase n=1 Tax=Microbacterium sediminicola TaxID=415210 RepID=A0ABN2HM93_9MICO
MIRPHTLRRYRFDDDVSVSEIGEAILLATPRGELSLSVRQRERRTMFHHLSDGGADVASLLSIVGGAATDTVWVYRTLEKFVRAGLVVESIGIPSAAVIRRMVFDDTGGRAVDRVRVDPTAYLRADPDGMIFECARSTSLVRVTDWRLPAVIATLAQASGVPWRELTWPEGVDDALAEAVVIALLETGHLRPDEDSSPELREWSFHDSVFHTRSRLGYHDGPYGGTYANASMRAPLPAVTSASDAPSIPLARPDLADLSRTDPPLVTVQESRQSWRRSGPRAVTADELGEFLYRSARVRAQRSTDREDISLRPYPGGGADYELEIYPLVNRVDGLDRGLYHYNPADHALVPLSPWSDGLEALADEISRTAVTDSYPDVMFFVTARMGRLTYKYEAIPYALALKDLGVLYSTWYMTATAMGLAPCALGGGDSALFAQVSGVSMWAEPRIGEFILNTPDPTERRTAPAEEREVPE